MPNVVRGFCLRRMYASEHVIQSITDVIHDITHELITHKDFL